MTRQRLESTRARSEGARRLQQALLDYHDYRHQHRAPDSEGTAALTALQQIQMARLRRTHQDLLNTPRYSDALEFLLDDLYAPHDLMQRDADLERIFPKAVRLLPDSLLRVMAELTELNMLTQQLDDTLLAMVIARWDSEILLGDQALPGRVTALSDQTYAAAFRACDNEPDRLRQMDLTQSIGLELEKYVGRKSVMFALQISEGAAQITGLGELHRFLTRGFAAFRHMGGVGELLDTISEREHALLTRLFSHDSAELLAMDDPFKL